MAFKQLFCITCLLLNFPALLSPLKAQDSSGYVFGNWFLFNVNTTEKANLVRQPVYFTASDTAIYTIFDQLNSSGKGNYMASKPASPVMLGVKLKPGLTNFYSGVVASVTQNYYSFVIRDSSDALLLAMGIDSSNYKDFRYRVVENDSVELVPWSAVTDLRKAYGAKKPFGFIGKFNRPGKWIVVEVYNTRHYAVREGVIFDWRADVKPILEQIIVSVPGNYFNLAAIGANKRYATRFDRVTKVPADFQFPADSVRYITFQFKKEESRVYSVHLIRHRPAGTDTLSQGWVDQYGYFVADPTDFKKAGKYEFVFQRKSRNPEWDNAQLLRIPFEVMDSAAKTTLVKRLFIVLGITIISLLASFWIYRRRLKKMMLKLAQQRESVQLKLKSVRSQLNPHFIFNALSAIQNLMNKQRIYEANHYLSRFASLTRATLDSSEQDMISLEQEWSIADNYLQMEQLRFPFTYTLKRDTELPAENIELPPMLLQPLIENAVKHGVAPRRAGHIVVSAQSAGKNLVLTVEDNGNGFDPGKSTGGFGLKLSRERLRLLNSLYPGSPFTMEIATTTAGTTIRITLNNWLQ